MPEERPNIGNMTLPALGSCYSMAVCLNPFLQDKISNILPQIRPVAVAMPQSSNYDFGTKHSVVTWRNTDSVNHSYHLFCQGESSLWCFSCGPGPTDNLPQHTETSTRQSPAVWKALNKKGGFPDGSHARRSMHQQWVQCTVLRSKTRPLCFSWDHHPLSSCASRGSKCRKPQLAINDSPVTSTSRPSLNLHSDCPWAMMLSLTCSIPSSDFL